MLSIMQGNASSPSANLKVNNANVPSSLSPSELIIDSVATNHIISSPTLLVNSKENTSLPLVVMPNGNHVHIIFIGTLPLSPIVSLTNVLGGTILQSRFDVSKLGHKIFKLSNNFFFFLLGVFYRI